MSARERGWSGDLRRSPKAPLNVLLLVYETLRPFLGYETLRPFLGYETLRPFLG